MPDAFDPDAYLAEKEAEARGAQAAPPMEFDPDAYLREKQPQVSALETAAHKWANTLPLGRPALDMLGTAMVQGAKAAGAGSGGVRLTPQAEAETRAMGLDLPGAQNAIPGVLDTYRQIRDRRDVRAEAGAEQHPWASRAGTALGIANTVLLPMPKALGGGSAAGQTAAALTGRAALRQAMKTGATLGGLQALGDSKADLTTGEPVEFGKEVLDGVIGAAAGAGAGALGHGAAHWTPKLLRATAQKLREWGVAQGRRTLLNGAYSQSTQKFSDEAVEEAIRSGAIRPFGTTQGAAQRLENLTSDVGAAYGAIVEGLEKQGVKGPGARALADDLMRRGQELAPKTMNDPLPAAWKDAAEKLLEKTPEPARIAQMNSYKPAYEPVHLSLSQAESMKQSLQEMAKYGRTYEAPLNEARREIASVFRQANEDAIAKASEAAPQNSEIAQMAEEFVPVKQRLGRLLEAEAAAQSGMQRAQNRAALSLNDHILASGAGDPVSGAGVALTSRVARNRGPSTVASGSYWASELARALANRAQLGVVRGTLPRTGAQLVGGETRAQLPDVLPDWKARRDAEERAKIQAYVDALRRRQ